MQLDDFTDSREVYEYLKNGCENGAAEENHLPEIVFLDINMPVINGFELLDRVRSIPDSYFHKRKMNFFILTTSLNPNDRSTATKTYGDLIKGYLDKPLTDAVFLNILKQYAYED